MEIVFVTVIGAALAGIVRYIVPGRQTHGLGLIPGVGAAATATVWAISLWLGLSFDGGWIWAISLTLGVATAVAVAIILPRVRDKHDAEQLHLLSGGRA